MKITKLMTMGFLIISGCASYKAAVKRDFNNSAIINKDYDKTWAAVVKVFADKNISIKNIEKASGIISTEKLNYNPFDNDSNIDCGQLNGGFNPNTNQGFVVYNVLVEKIDAKSSKVTINLKPIMITTFQNINFSQSKETDCYSTGKFESDFFDKVKN